MIKHLIMHQEATYRRCDLDQDYTDLDTDTGDHQWTYVRYASLCVKTYRRQCDNTRQNSFYLFIEVAFAARNQREVMNGAWEHVFSLLHLFVAQNMGLPDIDSMHSGSLTKHLYGLYFSWTVSMWFFKCHLSAVPKSQIEHLYGFTSSWIVFICLFRCDLWVAE